MGYIALLSWRPGLTAEQRDGALARRLSWQYPEGLRMIAEHWPLTDAPAVVAIFTAEDYAAVWELVSNWNDVFSIDVHPAISAEEGLKLGPEVFGRLPRLQPQ